MREQGLAARRKKKRKGTTRAGQGPPDARAHRTWSSATSPPRRSTRSGTGTAPRSPTGEGKLYLASVLDMASRRILGFALASTTTRSWLTAR